MLEVEHTRAAVLASGEHEVAVGDQRPHHRQQDRRHQHDDGAHRDGDDDAEPLRSVQPFSGELRILERHNGSRLIHETESCGDHGQTGEAQRAVAQPGRLPSGDDAIPPRVLDVHQHRVGEQDRAQTGHLGGPDRIEGELGVTAGALTRADLHHGQAEQPVQ